MSVIVFELLTQGRSHNLQKVEILENGTVQLFSIPFSGKLLQLITAKIYNPGEAYSHPN